MAASSKALCDALNYMNEQRDMTTESQITLYATDLKFGRISADFMWVRRIQHMLMNPCENLFIVMDHWLNSV